MADSNTKYNIHNFSPYGNILKPYQNRKYGENLTFTQSADFSKFEDYREEINEQSENYLENFDKPVLKTFVHEKVNLVPGPVMSLEEAEEQGIIHNLSPVKVKPEGSTTPGGDDSVIKLPEFNTLTQDEKNEIILNVQNAKLTGKKHTTIDKTDVQAVIDHKGDEVTEDTSIFDLYNDGVIDDNDVMYVRYAIWAQFEKNNIVVADNARNLNPEDLYKLTINPTSTACEVYLDGKLASKKAIMAAPNSNISWRVVSGQYTEEGTYENITANVTYKVVISQDLTATNFRNAAASSGGGRFFLTEDVVTGPVTPGVLSSGETILDMQGHSYTCTDKTRPAFNVRNTLQYTIKGNGTISNVEGAGFPILYANGAGVNMYIESGTFICSDQSGECIYSNNGKIYISGGTFKSLAEDRSKVALYLLNCLDANYKAGTANIIVTGGKFYGFDPANSNDGNYVADGYISVMHTDDITGETYYEVIPQN